MRASEHTVFCRSNVARLREALVKRPEECWRDVPDAVWASLGFTRPPDTRRAEEEHRGLTALLEREGVRLRYLTADPDTDPDSIYTHDPATAVATGLVLCAMGKETRRGEPAAFGRFARAHELPVLGTIEGSGLVEGGDVIWLDEETLAAGLGYRSNLEGARQLAHLASANLVQVPLPHWNGPSDVLHLMSMISPIADDLMLIYRRLLPVPFLQELAGRGITLVDVPDEEFESLGCNVLALAPRRCLAVAGNPVTRSRLEKAGCEVLTFSGDEIALTGLGGPTCLTRPIVRYD